MKITTQKGKTVYAIHYDFDKLASVLEAEYLGTRTMGDVMIRLPNGELLEVGGAYDELDIALNEAMKYNRGMAKQYKMELENQKKDIEQLSTHMAQTMIRVGKLENIPLIKWALTLVK